MKMANKTATIMQKALKDYLRECPLVLKFWTKKSTYLLCEFWWVYWCDFWWSCSGSSGILLFSEKSEFFRLSFSAVALTENLAVFLDFVGLVTVVGGSALVAVVESERGTKNGKQKWHQVAHHTINLHIV